MHKIAMIGAGFIGRFYTMSLLNFRGKDEIKAVWRQGRGSREVCPRVWNSSFYI